MKSEHRCPECGTPLAAGAFHCICGWGQRGQTNAPPRTDAELRRILSAWITKHGKLPAIMPPTPEAAAAWWMSVLEPADERHERVQKMPVKGKEAERWASPYTERVCFCLLQFLELPDKDQRIIVAASQDKIYWRGDDMKFFMAVISETERIKKIGAEAYKKELQGKEVLGVKIRA